MLAVCFSRCPRKLSLQKPGHSCLLQAWSSQLQTERTTWNTSIITVLQSSLHQSTSTTACVSIPVENIVEFHGKKHLDIDRAEKLARLAAARSHIKISRATSTARRRVTEDLVDLAVHRKDQISTEVEVQWSPLLHGKRKTGFLAFHASVTLLVIPRKACCLLLVTASACFDTLPAARCA